MLTSLFNDYPPEYRPSSVEPVLNSGFSRAEVFRVASPAGAFALRGWPADHPSNAQLAFIHHALATALRRGCAFVPLPIASREGKTIVEHNGRRWQLEPWLSGSPRDPTPRPQEVVGAFRALAELHAAIADVGPAQPNPARSPGLTERVRVLEACLAGDIQQVRIAVAASSQADWPSTWRSAAEEYFRLFELAAPPVYDLLGLAVAREVRLQPVVRDIHREHVLFTGDQVTGIVDFGAMTVDHPAVDLARLLGSFEIDDAEPRRELVRTYDAGFGLDEHILIDAFDRSGALLSPFRWLWWLFVERRTFRDLDAVARRFDVLLQRLTRLAAAPPQAGSGLSLF